jgi:hypothetical protein
MPSTCRSSNSGSRRTAAAGWGAHPGNLQRRSEGRSGPRQRRRPLPPQRRSCLLDLLPLGDRQRRRRRRPHLPHHIRKQAAQHRGNIDVRLEVLPGGSGVSEARRFCRCLVVALWASPPRGNWLLHLGVPVCCEDTLCLGIGWSHVRAVAAVAGMHYMAALGGQQPDGPQLGILLLLYWSWWQALLHCPAVYRTARLPNNLTCP